MCNPATQRQAEERQTAFAAVAAAAATQDETVLLRLEKLLNSGVKLHVHFSHLFKVIYRSVHASLCSSVTDAACIKLTAI